MRKQLYLITTTLLLLFIVVPMRAYAQRNTAKIEQQRKYVDDLKKEINATGIRAKEISNQKGFTYKQVEELNVQINLRSTMIDEIEREIALIREDSLAISESIAVLEADFNSSRRMYGEMVKHAYRMSRRNIFATYIFSSTSIEEFSRRMTYVERFADRYRKVAYTARHQQAELAAVRENLEMRRLELDSVRESLNSEKANLRNDQQRVQKEYNELSFLEKSVLEEKKRKQAEYEKADAQLKKILAENTEGSSFSANTRGLKLPIEGGKIRPLQKNMAEISGPRDADVRCVEAGTVGEVTASTGGHYIIKIAHGKEFYTVYTHVTNVCVKVGQKVKENQKIGTAGTFIDYDRTTRAFIQFMVYNHSTGKMEEVMKFFSPK